MASRNYPALSARGRNGGGRGELLFDQAELGALARRKPDLAAEIRIDPGTIRINPDERISLGHFETLIGKRPQDRYPARALGFSNSEGPAAMNPRVGGG